MRRASLDFSDVKFPQDSVHQNYRNCFIVCRVTQNIKGGGFLRQRIFVGGRLRMS